MSGVPYVGRFAPSPTGPLHFGSLLAALGSFLEARRAGGQWQVRIEDLDPPREVPGSADLILRTLDDYQLHWDGPLVYQSRRLDRYCDVIGRLLHEGLAYRCRCTRRMVAAHPGGIYPGTCRKAAISASEEHAIRLVTSDEPVTIDDAVQGRFSWRLASETGDFVIRRRDGLHAYQLAVTIDDAAQGITHIVRGCDLLDSTPRQSWLRKSLSLPEPRHAHLPLALDPDGNKLSKSFGAAGLPKDRRGRVMFDALVVLRQDPPPELADHPVAEVIDWAQTNWNINKLHGISALQLDQKLQPTEVIRGAVIQQRFDS
ncbi:MAG: tRNA glutamyl-Q(34) synthetase GluQRS [Gammaproteobacteria bacterium]|nr:tRNA glutamyl-Q(34) synthetase GluQRS [Gammaproteobacteria bacterium]NNF61136.1 tRNA glutamyl-Q(34) synthetase GluQRS [Gammaproteobacteria bacterium]